MTAQEIGDQIEITQLLYRYARALDTRDYALLDSVFTPDAIIHYDIERGTKLPYPEMRKWLEQALTIFCVTQHVMSNPLIEFDGDEARSTTYLTAQHVQIKLDGEEALTTQGGTYTDLHRRTRDGWRIARRTLNNVYVAGRFLMPDEVRHFDQPPKR